MPPAQLRQFLLACGAALIIVGLAVFGATGGHVALAQTLPPRPPPPATATTIPEPAPGAPRPTPVVPGRITGTVIDQRTGAPTPGVTVLVGSLALVTDAHGNYEVNGLTPSTYAVALSLAAGQGTNAQAPVTVALAAGQTVVQHLVFRSPAQAEVVLAPPSTPVLVPTTLPATGAPGTEGWPWLVGAVLLMGVGATLRRAGTR